jgi:hypothetical protein
MMGRRIGVLAAAAVLAAGACSSAPSTMSTVPIALESSAPFAAAGTCLAGARFGDAGSDLADAVETYGLAAYEALADAPAWTDQIDCFEPHSFEIYGVVSLPTRLDNEISTYTDLLSPTGSEAEAIHAAVQRECGALIEPRTPVNRAVKLDVDAYPLLRADLGTFTAEPAPPKAWAAGDRTFGCLFEQPAPGTLMVADLMSPDLPLAQRTCLDGTDFVTCSKPHDVERIATLAVDRAVEAKQLAGLRAVDDSGTVDLGMEEWAALDRVCQGFLTAISERPSRGLRGVADTYPELYPDDQGHYSVLCTAQSRFGTSPGDRVVSSTSVYNQ